MISHSFTLQNFMNGVNSSFPRSFLAFDVSTYLAALAAYDGHLRPDGSVYDYALAAPEWNPLQSYRVTERTGAFYVQADMSGERWDGNLGVRVVKTRTTAQAWDAQITSITENGEFNHTATYADPTPISQKGDYTYVLPAANFVWHFSEDLLLRLGAAKTMARPSVEQLAPTNTTESVSWGEFTQVFGGNVDLKPYTATQGDASLEWYFAENSIFNVAVFYKRIENQITTSWETGQDIGVGPILDADGNPITDGPTLFNIIRPINGDYAKVHGFEAGLQHFWENGLGFRAQYTRNWSESWVDGEKRPLEGIAPSVYSLSLMYEGTVVHRRYRRPHRRLRHRHQRPGPGAATNRPTRSPGSPRTCPTSSTTASAWPWKARICWTIPRPTASTAIRCCRRAIIATAGRST